MMSDKSVSHFYFLLFNTNVLGFETKYKILTINDLKDYTHYKTNLQNNI